MKQLIILISIAFFATSCDPGVHFERIIYNQSSQDIWVKVEQETYPPFVQDSFMIPKNSSVIVVTRGGLGQVSEFENCGLADGTLSAGVLNNDTLQIEKNLSDNGSWTSTVKKKGFGGGGECNCILTITDEDIH